MTTIGSLFSGVGGLELGRICPPDARVETAGARVERLTAELRLARAEKLVNDGIAKAAKKRTK